LKGISGGAILCFHIYISLRLEGWDKDVFAELELPEELEVKYLNKGRSHKTTVDTGIFLQTIASNGINVSVVADTLYIWQNLSALLNKL
jgi:hypothetical protein